MDVLPKGVGRRLQGSVATAPFWLQPTHRGNQLSIAEGAALRTPVQDQAEHYGGMVSGVLEPGSGYAVLDTGHCCSR
jgi:hypothetical protein